MNKYMVKIKDSEKQVIVRGNGVEDEGKFYAIGDSRHEDGSMDACAIKEFCIHYTYDNYKGGKDE